MLEQVFQCVWNVSSSEENQKSKALFQNRTKKREKKKKAGIVPQENSARAMMEAENDLNSSFTAKCK